MQGAYAEQRQRMHTPGPKTEYLLRDFALEFRLEELKRRQNP